MSQLSVVGETRASALSDHESSGATATPRGAALRSNIAFRWLWLSRAVSMFGSSLSLVALLLYVADGTGRAFAVAALLLVGDFAPALLGPLTGVLSDRFDLRRVMIGCELAQAVAVLVIALVLRHRRPDDILSCGING
ncbi:MAG TPA: MFS transporter [Pseudonocardiaceae bacterium]